MFRRGRRHEAQTKQSSPGEDEQPFWLPGKGVEPEGTLVAPRVALLRYDSPPWLADKEVWQRRNEHRHAPSPLRGVSTQEVVEALGSAFSPVELDWDLVGVAFVHATPLLTEPVQPLEVAFEEPPWAGGEEPAPADVPEPPRMAPGSTPPAPRKWLPEHDEIMAAVRDLSWEGYRTLLADMFRHDGYEVFEGEGPDSDVIDMEVIRGGERKLVNCQLRGLGEIGTEALSEMAGVALRNGADGVFIIVDGSFTPDAWSLADGKTLVLIDRDALLGLVLDFTLGDSRERSLRTQVRRFLSVLQPGGNQWAS
jgi:hypothetical protein